jgi:hypothetical protein
VSGEFALTFLAYNMKRAINILGVGTTGTGAPSFILEFFIKNFGNARILLDKKTTVVPIYL